MSDYAEFVRATEVDTNAREKGPHHLEDTTEYMARSIGRLEIMMGEMPGSVTACAGIKYLNDNPKVMMDRQRKKLLSIMRAMKPYEKVRV